MFYWPLMKNCITKEDKEKMIGFLQEDNRLTNGIKVKEFEKEWSKWLGVKHSLFVSSGSTANFLLIASIKELYGLKEGDKIIVPPITWMTNISPIIQLGLKPIFCDVNLKNFSFNVEKLEELSKKHNDIKAIFITHLFGIPAEVEEYKKIFPKAIILEDVCESHGAIVNGSKAGNLSEGSTFSFYFGHHMTTIEGGMICTNNEKLYQLMRMKRSHGLAREASEEVFDKYKKENPEILPSFLFATDGYNFRSMELNAVLGLSQLKYLDENNKKRINNFSRFFKMIHKSSRIKRNISIEGNSSFCLLFICDTKELKIDLEKYLKKSGIETRPLCGGNLLRQPFLKNYDFNPKDFPNAELLHENGFYIGNNHLITEEDFKKLEKDFDNFFKN